MQKGRVLALTLVLLSFSRPAAAGDLFTCQTLGGFNSCAGATFWVEENPELGSLFTVNLTEWTTDLPLRLTAFGFYAKRGPTSGLEPMSSPSAWGGQFTLDWTKPKNRKVSEPRLGGYTLFAATSVPVPDAYDFAFGGPLYSGDVFQFSLDGSLPDDIRWVWRAQSVDGSIVLDCFQGPSGSTQCLSGSRHLPLILSAVQSESLIGEFATAQLDCDGSECLSTVPEPTTLLLVLAGLLGISMAGRRRLRRPG